VIGGGDVHRVIGARFSRVGGLQPFVQHAPTCLPVVRGDVTMTRISTPHPEAWEERLLDDAIDDTFPASDPVSHGQPGSIVNLRYAERERRARVQRRHRANATAWLVGLCVAIALTLVIVGRRRR
jgi:hypothetical protein